VRGARPQRATIALLAAFLLAAGLLAAGCGSEDEEPERTVVVEPRPEEPDRRSIPIGDGEGGVELTKIGDFDEPVYVTQPPDAPANGPHDLYVVEKGGTIQLVRDGAVRESPFLDISDQVSDGTEQGLLSVAFAPDYAETGRFYVDYTDRAGDTRVVEYRRAEDSPVVAERATARELLFIDQPYSNHNGGLVLFGPDGQLYIGSGDGGSAGDPDRNGQDLGTLLGKLLRIDPLPSADGPYGIPADNPFADSEEALPEIYSYGLRNPWRFSFDRETGDLYIADVGQDAEEEINLLSRRDAAGANFGWSAFEGFSRFNTDQPETPSMVEPIFSYGPEGGCSVTGGHLVRDPYLTSLYGRYLYADYCEGRLRSFVPALAGARDDRELCLEVPALTSFGEDNAGRIYVASQTGPVYRLDPQR
jgi:glucose/arabinose dehydrogenase